MTTILIIDDNESIHQTFRRILTPRLKRLSFLDSYSKLNNHLQLSPETEEVSTFPNFELLHAYQGQQALDLIRNSYSEGKPIPLVFSDVRMPPGPDGIETIQHIWEEFPDVEIVIMTAFFDYSIQEIQNRFKKSSQLMFIRKPFDKTSVTQLAISLTAKWELSQKVKNYVEELEMEVEQRTLSLSRKNQELKSTLDNLNETQKYLLQSEKMVSLGNLVAGVAHEISTPLGVSVTASSHLFQITNKLNKLFQEGHLKQSELNDFVQSASNISDIILKNLNRASELLSSFKRVAVDQTSEELRKFNVYNYINEILVSLKPKFKNKNVEIKFDCPENVEIFSYPGSLSQILTNLVINSLLHGFENIKEGIIEINVKELEGRLQINYRDNGVGIAAENKQKIFDPFFTTKRGKGGTGLGLHIIYNIIEQKLNGSINLDEEVEKGTAFSIEFPVKYEYEPSPS